MPLGTLAHGTVAEPTPAPAIDPAEIEAAEKAAWDYYLEWSTVARRAISDRRLLISMGVTKPRSRKGQGDDSLDEGDDFDDEADDLDDDDLDSVAE